MHAVLDQIADVGIAPQKPEQLVDHPFQEDLLGGQQRESFAEVETHLVAEDAARAVPLQGRKQLEGETGRARSDSALYEIRNIHQMLLGISFSIVSVSMSRRAE